jgi:hypothetical protein
VTIHAVEAKLIGSTTCTARSIRVSGHAPVFALCRALIGAGYDPERPLHVYRGKTLCLRVRSIAEGAKFTVREGTGRPSFRPLPPQDWASFVARRLKDALRCRRAIRLPLTSTKR